MVSNWGGNCELRIENREWGIGNWVEAEGLAAGWEIAEGGLIEKEVVGS